MGIHSDWGRRRVTDFTTWLLDNDGRIYRYWVYKRMFTPAEQEAKWSDQTCFEEDECYYGRIEEDVELPDGDVLLGFASPELDGGKYEGSLDYYKLSQILLAYVPSDAEEDDA